VRSLLLLAVVAACGARTELRGEPITDATAPEEDHVVADASSDACASGEDPSASATSSFGACGEGVNITTAPSDNCGGAGAAFEYIPDVDVLIDRIELHTNAAVVGLLDSDCDLPGKTLFLAELDTAGTNNAWRGADVYPQITVKAKHKYFVWQAIASGHDDTHCSIATTGVMVREYTAPSASGPWSGPFSGLAWSARLDGVCP
jgi:hypothetical protein